jgi:predicted metal-dependent hydrolase
MTDWTKEEDEAFNEVEKQSNLGKQILQAQGQPYHWEADAIKAAVMIEREECARLAEKQLNWGTALAIRARNDTSSKRVDITEEHKHDN